MRNIRKTILLTILLYALPIIMSLEIVADSTLVYRLVLNEEQKIAITFDDGPHPYQTVKILDTLERYGVHATFFMIGENIKNYPEIAKEVIVRGNEVGNHTFHHKHLKWLSEGEMQKEVDGCEDELEELCEYRPHLLRPPEGVVNSYVKHCSSKGEYRIILWSIDTRDWEIKNAEEIAERVIKNVKSGDIILMHDYVNQSKTPEALELLLPKLLALGYEPVTVSELLGIR